MNRAFSGPFFSNVSQSSRGRAQLCNADSDLLQRLLPFLSHENYVRRGGIIGRGLVGASTDDEAIHCVPSEVKKIVPFFFRFIKEHLLRFDQT